MNTEVIMFKKKKKKKALKALLIGTAVGFTAGFSLCVAEEMQKQKAIKEQNAEENQIAVS